MFLIKKNKVMDFIPYFIFSKISKKNIQINNNLGLLKEFHMLELPIIISFMAFELESDKDIMDYTVFVENDNTFKELLILSVDFPSDYHGKNGA